MSARPQDFGLRGDFADEWRCTCGIALAPDCDISTVSINEEFERHLMESHGFTKAQIDDAVRA